MLDLNVKLSFWVLAAPVLLEYFLDELLAVDDLAVSFFFIELVALPNVGYVLVVFVAWYTVLSPDAKNKEGVFHQIIVIEHSGGLVPVWITIKLWLHLLLFIALLIVGIDLVYGRLSFHKVEIGQL